MSGAAEFELRISRLIDAPPATVWRVWIERIEEWWAPKPYATRMIEMDLRAGGRSAMEMTGPDGFAEMLEGVYLEVVPGERIVVTDAFRVGWVPHTPFMTGFWEFAEEDGKTRYTAGARHWTAEAMKQHDAMGFTPGWTAVADQLAALAEAED